MSTQSTCASILNHLLQRFLMGAGCVLGLLPQLWVGTVAACLFRQIASTRFMVASVKAWHPGLHQSLDAESQKQTQCVSRVIAWEPVPQFRAFLEYGTALNNFSALITIRWAGRGLL